MDAHRAHRSLPLPTAGLALAALGALTTVAACIPDVVPDVFTLPNCDQVKATCGPSGTESCCESRTVSGGQFVRSTDGVSQAHVSSFMLDRFEVTVGRFRQFVGGYPANKPARAAGLHPLIPGSGWDPAWDTQLPKDQTALKRVVGECDLSFATWTDAPGSNEDLPINCVSWYVAFAFCAWDGGRLPTEAEWNYAAAGGNQQRVYPWGSPSAQTVDVLFGCPGPFGKCVRAVGAASPASDGFFGQADLAGSMAEWNLDFQDVYKLPCTDCAQLVDAGHGREARGGDFVHGSDELETANRLGFAPETPVDTIGVRCARDP